MASVNYIRHYFVLGKTWNCIHFAIYLPHTVANDLSCLSVVKQLFRFLRSPDKWPTSRDHAAILWRLQKYFLKKTITTQQDNPGQWSEYWTTAKTIRRGLFYGAFDLLICLLKRQSSKTAIFYLLVLKIKSLAKKKMSLSSKCVFWYYLWQNMFKVCLFLKDKTANLERNG